MPKAAHQRGRTNQRMEEGRALEERPARMPLEDHPPGKDGKRGEGGPRKYHRRLVQWPMSEEESCASRDPKRMPGPEGRLRKLITALEGGGGRGALTTLILY